MEPIKPSSCPDVHAVGVDVVIPDDYIAEVDANAEFHPYFVGRRRVLDRQVLLKNNRAMNSVDGAGKLHERAVTARLDGASTLILGDNWIEDFASQQFEPGARTGFVGPLEPAVARHVGSQYRR